MSAMRNQVSLKIAAFVLGVLLCGSVSTTGAQSLDELHKLALKEGGTVNFYGTLAQINAERILPVFEKRFPGMKVNHVDATADKLAARAITEARGGRVPGRQRHPRGAGARPDRDGRGALGPGARPAGQRHRPDRA